MFQSFKIFVGQTITPEKIVRQLVAFKYDKVRQLNAEGDFSQRGEVLDIFPVRFQNPIRIVFEYDRIERIESLNMRSDKPILHHQIVIVLPRKKPSLQPFDVEMPLNNFVDIEQGDYIVHANHGIGRYLGITPVEVKNEMK
ncbi:MAG TPA: CarD family transcriptional regulator, partial [Candidatus Omnitrophota bacterium]|nr:CarD family transcriptional regulator [Candidatus Omnitrophota bacterium]